MIIDNLPFDKYELEPSPLTLFILGRKQPNYCWQVFIQGSTKNGETGHPFGYLKASTNLLTVNLFVLPYNYPMLLPLLAAASLALSAAGGLDGYPSVPMKGVRGEVAMPLVGIGTWQYDSPKAQRIVSKAFELGYRHVDTALVYGNHAGVGAALRGTGLARGEYFVTTKIPGGLNASAAVAAADRSLAELGLDAVDLLLVHYPAAFDRSVSGRAARVQEWLALEAWARAGKARALGVSHHCRSQMLDILSAGSVPIALNQVEYHVGMGHAGPSGDDDRLFCERQGIVYMSFSPLCGPCAAPRNTTLLQGDLVSRVGRAHKKTGAQAALRWLVQQGIPVVPKSDKPKHLRENFELFDFELTQQEMRELTDAKEPAVSGGGDGVTSGDCSVSELLV